MARILPIRQKQFAPFSHFCNSLTDKTLQSRRLQDDSVKCQDKLKQLINHQAYNLSMALLTIYSIFAIDIEKALFGQQQAYIFGYIHIVAILIFSIQMTLNSIGKQGYRASFYFWIDLISTISMTMEITWVDNYLAANSNLPGILTIAKVVKASRLSRIGSRAAKIIFLFLQYWKNKKQEEQKIKQIQNKMTESVIGQSNLRSQTAMESRNKDELDFVLEQDALHQQIANQLPKKFDYRKNGLQPIQQQKITEKSQENEIIGSIAERSSQSRSKESVLQPNFFGKRRSKIAFPAQIGSSKKRADKSRNFQFGNIVERMQQTFKMQPLERPNVDIKHKEQIQRRWNEICQRELQANKQQKQKIKSDKQNFKLGQTLKQRIQKNIIIMIMSLIIILPLISADTWLNKDPTIGQLMQKYIEFAATLDSNASKAFLNDMIVTANSSTYPILSLQAKTNTTILQYPGNILAQLDNSPPLNDFMQVQIINASTADFTLVFNARNIDQINGIINIARSCFITILLIFSTIIFMHSIESKALAPLQNMCKSINKISVNPFDALKEVNEKDQNQSQKGRSQKQLEQIDKNDLQTNMLERTIWKMTKIVALGAGQTGSQLISTKIDNLNSETNYFQFEGSKIHGVFLAIKIAKFEENCRKNQQFLLSFINNITKKLHELAMANAGVILQSSPPSFLFFWKTPQDLNIENQPTKYYIAKNPMKNLGKTVQTQKIIQVVLRTYLKMNLALVQLNKKKFQELKIFKEQIQEQFEFFSLQAGIHLGDAYQGSVGNRYKIEVKSIGNDIDFVKRMPYQAQKYCLSNIVSQQIYDIIDDPAQNNLRKVDQVKQPKWQDRFYFCTFDFTLTPIVEPNKYKIYKKNKEKTQLNQKKRQKTQPSQKKSERKYLKIQKSFKDYCQKDLIHNRRSFILSKLNSQAIEAIIPYTYIQKLCLKPYNINFYKEWAQGFEYYYKSQWDFAAEYFQRINAQKKAQHGYKDPISTLFLDRIVSNGGVAFIDLSRTIELEQYQQI